MKFLIGYEQAAEFPGSRRLQRMVERRSIRVIKENKGTVMFEPNHLIEDLLKHDQPRIDEFY